MHYSMCSVFAPYGKYAIPPGSCGGLYGYCQILGVIVVFLGYSNSPPGG